MADKSDSDESTDFPSYIPLTTRRASASDDEDEQQKPQQRQNSSSPTRRKLLRSEELEGLGLAPDSDSENEEQSEEEEIVQEVMLNKCEEEVVKKYEERQQEEGFYVPAYSSYYMHDDRCTDGRSARTFDQDKPKHFELEGKWPHDKFEELNLQENEYCQRKGKWQTNGNDSRPHHLEKLDQSSRIVRGRGPVRYKPLTIARNYITRPAEENNQSVEGRLNTLSAPAYDFDKMNSQPGTPTSVLAEGIRFSQQSSAFQQGMTTSDHFGHKSLIYPVENHHTDMPLKYSTFATTYTAPYLQSRDQGWNWDTPYPAYPTDNTMVSRKEVVEEYCRTPYPAAQRLSLKSADKEQLSLANWNGSEDSLQALPGWSVRHALYPAYPVPPAYPIQPVYAVRPGYPVQPYVVRPGSPIHPPYPVYDQLGLGDSRMLREEASMKNIRTNRMTGGRPELVITESTEQKFRLKSQPRQERYKPESQSEQEKYKPWSQSEQGKYKPRSQPEQEKYKAKRYSELSFKRYF